MSVSRLTIGRRTIAAVAAFSMITTGTVVTAPVALAEDDPICTTDPAGTKNGSVECLIADGVTPAIFPGSIITLKLTGFNDRSGFSDKGQPLFVKIDGGDVAVPEATEGTSFDEIVKRGTQVFGAVTDLKKLPNAENGGTTEFKVRLPEGIAAGEHSINLLGGKGEEGAAVVKKVKFTVVDAVKYPKGRLTAKRAGTQIESVAQGTTVDLHATRLAAGMKVIFAGVLDPKGDNVLPDGTFMTNDKGEVVIPGVKVPADAPLDAPFGIILEKPDTGERFSADNRRYGVTVNEKDTNADMIKVEKSVHTPSGLYQSAYSASQNKLFVTRARGIDEKSELMAYDPATLERDKASGSGELADTNDHIFGIAIDEANGNIWTTRTLGKSMTVFDLKTGQVKKHFANKNHGLEHPFSVAINSKNDTVYVSDVTSRSKEPVGKDTIKLYDAKTLEEKGTIDIPSMPTGALHLLINEETQKLYTVDFTGKTAAVVDLGNGNTVTNIDLKNPEAPGDRGAGIALDTKRDRLWVATQSPSWVKVVDLKTNEVINKEGIRTGASPLDVLYDAKNDVIWAMNRVGASVNILDPETMEIKATRNLDLVDDHTAYLNHLSTDGEGNVFVTSKPSRDQGETDVLFKLSYNNPETTKDPEEKPGDNNKDPDKNDGKDNSGELPGSSKDKDKKDNDKKDGDKKDGDTTKPSSSPKISISSDNTADKPKKDDGSSNGGGIFAIIAVIAALLGGLGFAVTQGMIPGVALPAIPGLPMPK